ncbi:MAG TPA: response regulator [Anaeromyxobacteraceae bacterium]|nr:response regulator [Anaeromyxobacteraceae bacterium]
MPETCLILAVDDDAEERARWVTALETAGYRVVEASNGREALAHFDAGTVPHVLVLDLMMPELDGASLLQALRDRGLRERVRVVLATGVSSPLVRRLIEADAYLFKPFDEVELLAAVAQACARGLDR